jgi:hypothetical protein
MRPRDMYRPAADGESLFKKIRDAIEGRESRLFLETPAGLRGDDQAFGTLRRGGRRNWA